MNGKTNKSIKNSSLNKSFSLSVFHLKKNCFKILLILVLPLFLFPLLKIDQVAAQDETGDPDGRYKVVEIEYTQTTWQLMSLLNNQMICEVKVEYEGFPTSRDTKAICAEELALRESEDLINSDNGLLQNVYWIYISAEKLSRTEKIPLMEMYLDVEAPQEPLAEPYVLLKAIEPLSEYKITGIFGTLNGKPFECFGAICKVFISQDTFVEYWATSSFGDTSDRYNATIRIYNTPPEYKVEVTSKSTYFISGYKTLPDIMGLYSENEIPDWLNQPKNIQDLRTYNDLQYLAKKLINYGLVDTSSCPNNGLDRFNSPNACGLSASRDAVNNWQNGYDQLFWNAFLETGVPPQLLKALIQQESQFWPESAYHVYNEYGFGQLNELGADVALRWNSLLNLEVCESLNMNCGYLYASMSVENQAYLRGGLVRMVNVDCPGCDYGVDLDKAQKTISIFAKILMANANQVAYVLDDNDTGVIYEDIWKLSLVSYHSGYYYLEEAILNVLEHDKQMSWANISYYLDDPTAGDYVDNIWNNLERNYVNPAPTPTPHILYTPAVALTATPIPSPTPYNRVNGEIWVTAFIDSNGNKIKDPGEEVNNLPVEVVFEEGATIATTLRNGSAVLYFKAKTIGSTVQINLPSIYKAQRTEIPENGNIEIIFILDKAQVPIQLP